MESDRALPLSVLLECLCAAHLSSYVASEFSDRGGIILVGPPGVLKSKLLEVVDRLYHDAINISDINVPTLNDLKEQLAAGSIRTLVIPEFAKLYERDPRTARNLEGTMRALVAEGFRTASFEDARINTLVARCVVLTAITPRFQSQQFTRWEDSGFSRRFLWPLVRMRDPDLLTKSVEEGKLVRFGAGRMPPLPVEGVIRDETTYAERRHLRDFLKRQPGGVHNMQQLMLVRMLAVLKWWYAMEGRRAKPMDTVRTFARALGEGGAQLIP